ncbi:MAG: carboxypeptidase-like regulatory domain-containing protein, partial [Chitinophagaceae bacterium]
MFVTNLQEMKFFLFWLFLLPAAAASAQINISGKVIDQNGKPLPAVSISIKDSYDGATSDSLGNFSFTSTEKGEKTLEASFSGYTSFSKLINIESSPISLDISLKELITELKAVVI